MELQTLPTFLGAIYVSAITKVCPAHQPFRASSRGKFLATNDTEQSPTLVNRPVPTGMLWVWIAFPSVQTPALESTYILGAPPKDLSNQSRNAPWTLPLLQDLSNQSRHDTSQDRNDPRRLTHEYRRTGPMEKDRCDPTSLLCKTRDIDFSINISRKHNG